MAEKDKSEEQGGTGSVKKATVATKKKASARKKRVVKKKSSVKKKAVVKKKAAVKKKASPKKSSIAADENPPTAVVMSATVAETAEKKPVNARSETERQKHIQQRLEELGVTPAASRAEKKPGLDDRIFKVVVLGGVLFIVAIFAYETMFDDSSSPEQLLVDESVPVIEQSSSDGKVAEGSVAEEQHVTLESETPFTDVEPVVAEVEMATQLDEGDAASIVAESEMASAATAAAEDEGRVNVAESDTTASDKKSSISAADENLITLDETFGTPRFSYDRKYQTSDSAADSRYRFYRERGRYRPVPPPHRYYPPHPWRPPYYPYR